MWSRFEVDEKKGVVEEEKKAAEPAAETVDSELSRWFALNPHDNWYALFCVSDSGSRSKLS
jgi:hypothetical protein